MSKVQWHLSLAGVSSVFVEGHSKSLEKSVREHLVAVECLERLLRDGLADPTSLVVPLKGGGDVA